MTTDSLDLAAPPSSSLRAPGLFARLIEPRVALAGVAARRNARLTAASALVLGVGTVPCVVAALFAAPPISKVAPPTLAVFAVVYAVAYFLSRLGSHGRGGQLIVAAQLLAPVLIFAMLGESGYTAAAVTAGWLVLPVLTAAGLLELRAVSYTAAAAVAGLIVGCIASGTPAGESAHPAAMLATLVSVLVLVAWHRSVIARLHSKELRRRNSELEALRRSLEERVAERTAELETSHGALEAAYQSLQRNQRALVQSEKLAAIGRLTAGIAHEMSSPLAALRASTHELSLLVDEYSRSIGDSSVDEGDHREIADEMREACSLTSMAAERAAAFVAGVKAQTRDAGSSSSEPFDVAEVVRQALPLLAHAARAARCTVELDIADGSLVLYGAPARLSQVVINLTSNAIDASPDGHVNLRVARGNAEVIVAVEDDGCGMTEEVRAAIFEPLFTTKPHGRGTGLGLSIVKQIVEDEFGGRIGVSSTPGAGSAFTLHLPTPQGD